MVPYFPLRYERYIEPFLGGGSVALLLEPRHAILADAEARLIELWKSVVSEPEALLALANSWSFDKENYYRVRALDFDTPIERSAQFLYLNKASFNGVYRVNLAGRFNVPWGAPRTARIADLTNLISVSNWFQNSTVDILNSDFEAVLARAAAGDFVYVDPPYVTTHNDNGFRHYNEKLFSWSDQVRLADSSHAAVERGAKVLVSNADHPDVRTLYREFRRVEIRRNSTLSASSAKRQVVSEALFVSR